VGSIFYDDILLYYKDFMAVVVDNRYLPEKSQIKRGLIWPSLLQQYLHQEDISSLIAAMIIQQDINEIGRAFQQYHDLKNDLIRLFEYYYSNLNQEEQAILISFAAQEENAA
jgi:hypothetical protein